MYKITTYRQYFLQVEFRHGQAPTPTALHRHPIIRYGLERRTAKSKNQDQRQRQKMAILHLETKPISRSSGRSSTASSAYRAGVAIEDKRTGLTHDFERKKGIADKDCFMFHNGEKVTLDRANFGTR